MLAVAEALVPGVEGAVHLEPEHAGRHADGRELSPRRRGRHQTDEDSQAPRAIPHSPSREMPTPVTRLSSVRLASSLFESSFSSRPAVAASAPGRVNLIGEHTDYNGGPVLPVAVERRTAVAAALEDGWFFVSALDGTVRGVEIDRAAPGRLDRLPRRRRPRAAGDRRRAQPAPGSPWRPPCRSGAGLSSSAALTVAAAKALSLLAGRRLTPAQLVDVAYRAEHDQVGVRCGRMDQTIAAHAARGHGAAVRDGERRDPAGAVPGAALGGGDRRLAPARRGRAQPAAAGVRGGAGALPRSCGRASRTCRISRPTICRPSRRGSPPDLAARVRHVVTETFRTRMAADALGRGDLGQLGWLLVEGHESLRVDYRSTIPEADAIVELAMDHGAYGARLTGAGWGGCVVVLVAGRPERAGDGGDRARASASGSAASRRCGARVRRRGCGGRRCGRSKGRGDRAGYIERASRPGGETGRRLGLKILWGQPRPGSNPGPGTELSITRPFGLEDEHESTGRPWEAAPSIRST